MRKSPHKQLNELEDRVKNKLNDCITRALGRMPRFGQHFNVNEL